MKLLMLIYTVDLEMFSLLYLVFLCFVFLYFSTSLNIGHLNKFNIANVEQIFASTLILLSSV